MDKGMSGRGKDRNVSCRDFVTQNSEKYICIGQCENLIQKRPGKRTCRGWQKLFNPLAGFCDRNFNSLWTFLSSKDVERSDLEERCMNEYTDGF